MNRMQKSGFVLLFFSLMSQSGWNSCLADDNSHHDTHRKHTEKESKHHLPPVANPIYQESCGACHFAYQPQLLPAASWQAILDNQTDHFGESLELNSNARSAIAAYLQANSADKSGAKRAVKIMRSLGNGVPQRITDIPYIREKHHEISAQVFARPAIASPANCPACHTTAEQGLYDDDSVMIPQ
ncbi:MAG: diheme cytochrome c [Proteobacteria bacterium]|nr:diheme cytochrome c [Pseudomonadota bacterium]